jgi:hypothetical protein
MSDSSLQLTVKMLTTELWMESKFSTVKYESDEIYIRVLNKLHDLKLLVNKFCVDSQSDDHLIIDICIKNVQNGFSLTTGLVEILNDIHKKYARN